MSSKVDKKSGNAIEHSEYVEDVNQDKLGAPVANNEGAVANILSHLTKEELLADVDRFAQRFGQSWFCSLPIRRIR